MFGFMTSEYFEKSSSTAAESDSEVLFLMNIFEAVSVLVSHYLFNHVRTWFSLSLTSICWKSVYWYGNQFHLWTIFAGCRTHLRTLHLCKQFYTSARAEVTNYGSAKLCCYSPPVICDNWKQQQSRSEMMPAMWEATFSGSNLGATSYNFNRYILYSIREKSKKKTITKKQ